ncbi:MAG: alpha-amylase family protein [Bryobacteraceae bacterium]|nr:alpha-amylase family protein [Bryobacteraceae bacterium]
MLSRRDLARLAALASLASAVAQKKPLRRSECFLGMHFDLHPNDKDTALGRDVTEEMVEAFLARVKPDYVQYDCKGHVGYLGYPSAVSKPASGIVNDSLALWRKVTAKHGVGLFIHFSGVWDTLAVAEHPEWARITPDGKRDPNNTSVFSPYVDQRMIPQLKEAASRYDLDGVWVDGECWSVQPDYSGAAAKAFGSPLPKTPADPRWQEFLEFNRQRFRDYVRHYADEIHRFRPGFQIASNWLYSTYVPERPDLPVDFVSGDFLGNASISSARLEARYLAQIGMPWDLMAWGFQWGRNNAVGNVHKSAVALQQEASVVLAQGGGFQVYYQPTRAGKLDRRLIEVMGKVGDFCRARQAVSHKSDCIPQVGVLFSKRTLYRTTKKMFGGWGAAVNPARGFIDALVESGYSVDVIPDWKLSEIAEGYPLIVVPEWADIGEETRDALVHYVRQGGSTLVAGAANAGLFASLAGVTLRGAPAQANAFIAGEESFGNVTGIWQDIEAEALEQRYPTFDARDGAVAATLSTVGKGRLLLVPGPLGTAFAATHAPEVRRFVARLAARLFTPAYRIQGPPVLESALRRKNGKTLLHLANASAMQVAGDYSTSDYVPPVGPVTVTFAKPPKRAMLLPENRELPVTPGGSVTIPSIDIHAVLSLDA